MVRNSIGSKCQAVAVGRSDWSTAVAGCNASLCQCHSAKAILVVVHNPGAAAACKRTTRLLLCCSASLTSVHGSPPLCCCCCWLSPPPFSSSPSVPVSCCGLLECLGGMAPDRSQLGTLTCTCFPPPLHHLTSQSNSRSDLPPENLQSVGKYFPPAITPPSL